MHRKGNSLEFKRSRTCRPLIVCLADNISADLTQIAA